MSLKTKALLPSEFPTHAACRHRARDLLLESVLERRPPGNELESESVLDHREPAGGESDALAIDPCDVLAFGGRMMRESCLSG